MPTTCELLTSINDRTTEIAKDVAALTAALDKTKCDVQDLQLRQARLQGQIDMLKWLAGFSACQGSSP